MNDREEGVKILLAQRGIFPMAVIILIPVCRNSLAAGVEVDLGIIRTIWIEDDPVGGYYSFSAHQSTELDILNPENIPQLNRQFEQSQRLLEYQQGPRYWR